MGPSDKAVLFCLIMILGEVELVKRPTEVVFMENLKGYWEEIAKFAAVAFFPKTFFGMLFEEIYAMAVPLFVPEQLSKHVYTWWHSVPAGGPPASLLSVYDPRRPSTFTSLAFCE